METVAGTTAFITGGAAGIGFGMAQVLAKAGVNVVIADVNEPGAAAAAAKLQAAGGSAMAVPIDTRSLESWATALDLAEQRFGPVQILCNNAGVTGASDTAIDEVPEPLWIWVRSVNLDGMVNGLRVFVPRAKKHGLPSHIVNTGSVASYLSLPHLGDYTATKRGIAGITEVLRLELEGFDIGVSLLCPGTMNTQMWENSRRELANQPGAAGHTLKRNAEFEVLMKQGLDPVILGRLVLRGILAKRQNIFTHPEFRGPIAERFQTVLDDLDWAAANVEDSKIDPLAPAWS